MPFHKSRKSLSVLLGAALFAGVLGATPVLAVDGGGGGGGGGGTYGSGGGGGGGGASGASLADARIFIKNQNWAAAIKLLKRIVTEDNRNAEALNLLGYSLRKSGDYKNALGFYQRALKVNPRHKGANEYLGELYVETGNMGKAREQLAILEKLCGNTSCEEYQDLAKAMGI